MKTEDSERVRDLSTVTNQDVHPFLLDPKSWALPIEGAIVGPPLKQQRPGVKYTLFSTPPDLFPRIRDSVALYFH